MAIKSKVSRIIEDAMKERGLEVPDDKKGKYNSLVHELEQEMDGSLQGAFERLREKVERLGSEIGVDLKDLRDKIVENVRIEIPKDN